MKKVKTIYAVTPSYACVIECFLSLIFEGMSRNNHLESENKRLSLKVDEMKEICSLTSSLNVKYKMQLDREASDKEDLKESNHKLKLKLNQLSAKSNEQSQRIKVLENSLKRKPAVRASQPQVRIIGSVSDIVATDPRKSVVFVDLQTRYDELDAAHQEALNVIDELEFELGDVMTQKFYSRSVYLNASQRKLFQARRSFSFVSCLATSSDRLP